MKKSLLPLVFSAFMLAGTLAAPMPAAASLHISQTLYADETSAVALQDSNLVRKFAINVYDSSDPSRVQTVWFYFTPGDSAPGASLSDTVFRYSYDNQTWQRAYADLNVPIGKLFRLAWQYALGYPFT